MKAKKLQLSRRSSLKRFATIAGGLTLAHHLPSFSATGSRPIRIGHQCDITGALASTGYWRKKATDAAAKWLNDQGGINGRPIEVITVDTETKVDVGVLRMRQLIQDEKVDFVIGSEHGGIGLASNRVAEEFKTLYLSMSRTDSVTQKGLNPYVFRLMVNTSLTAKAAAPSMAEQVGKRWSILYADYVWGMSHRDAWTQWIKEAGGTVAQTQSMAVNTPDPLPYVSKLDRSVDGIYVALLGPDVSRGLSALRSMGFASKQILTADALFGVTDILALGAAAEGISGLDSAPWELADKDTPHMRTMRSACGIDAQGRETGTKRTCMMGDVWPSWENLGFLKQNVEGSGWKGPEDTLKLIKYIEANPNYKEGALFPQGDLFVRPADHQAFCDYYALRIEQGRIRVKNRMPKDAGLYPASVNIASS